MSSRRFVITALVACLGAAIVTNEARADRLFELVPNGLGAPPCSGDGCVTNQVVLADLDGDGDLDAVLPNCAGMFTPSGESQPLLFYRNDGHGHLTDDSIAAWGGFQGRIRQVAIGDIDGDGDLDVYAPDAAGGADALFINRGDGVFTNEAATRIGGAMSHAGAARFADVDDDGDLDLFVSDGFANGSQKLGTLYLNDGAGHFTPSANAFPSVKVRDIDDVDFADVDGDFDLDLIVNPHSSNLMLFLNDGHGVFSDGSSGLPPQASASHYDPAICDVNGDGALDIVIDNTGPTYTEQLLLNDGTGHFTDETDRIQGNTVGEDDNGIACIDFDGDGDLDLVVASLTSKGERVFMNDGTGHFTLVPDAFTPIVDGTLWIDFGDLDGDGRLDAITAQGEGTDVDQLYLGTTSVHVDDRAPLVPRQTSRALADGSREVIFEVVDDAVTDVGPRLERAWVDAGDATFDARFMGGDLFRAVVPKGLENATIVACAKDMRGNLSAGCMKTPPPPVEPAGCGCRTIAEEVPTPPAAICLGVVVGASALRLRGRRSARRRGDA